ncbi:MAG: TonB-dependent receptor, partial [Bacteroidota bacterium]|nr:TonB-dependent receptor [Bacteroidota bacterium]
MSKILTLMTCLISGSTLVSAQKDTLSGSSGDVIVTTATRSSLKQSQTGKIVTLIDRQTLQNNAGKSLSELLNNQAGFFINGANNTPGTNQDIYFRGAATGNMLVVIDGIPVFDPSQINNSFDFNSIPLQEIDHIEILKGGQSTLWGSDAVAGVIQLFLKKEAKKAIVANADISYGSYQTEKLSAGISGTLAKLGYHIQYSRTKSKGISAAYDSLQSGSFDKDGFTQNSVQASLRYQLTPALSASAFGNFSSYRADYDAGAFTDDKDYTGQNKNNLGGFSMQYKGKAILWNLLASYQQAKRNFTNDSNDISSIYSTYATGRYAGATTTLETFGNTRLSKNISLVSGLEYIRQNSDQYYFSTGAFGPYQTTLSKDSAGISQLSAYGSLLISDLHSFNLEMGGRYNHHSIYGNNGTFTFNPSFNLNGSTKFFLNISSAYKIPSLYHLYSQYGNKQLTPERSTTYELGIQQGS